MLKKNIFMFEHTFYSSIEHFILKESLLTIRQKINNQKHPAPPVLLKKKSKSRKNL